MKKKNIYFVQANNVYGTDRKSVYFPYAAGCIEAFLLENGTIRENYQFGKIQYTKLPLDEAVENFENPYMVLFSCYVWNFEYNKALAQRVKDKYPDCLITFGGHSVSEDGREIEEYPFVDFVTHRFGEEPTLALLLALHGGTPFCDVANISFRGDKGEAVTTHYECQVGTEYPSPYLCGIFDDIMKDDIEFSALFETNRGCPNGCTFCDWSSLKSKVRLFPQERVKAEIDWFADHGIAYIYCADGNFCLFNRDEEIADYIIASKKEKGYPQIFKVNFTKNKLDFVFKVGTKFCRNGLDKAQTISFQSMNREVLDNIGRKNISTEKFRELMNRYNEMEIPTYSELILGLPGETYESFCQGIALLIENGQHFAMNIFPCEIIPNATMAKPDYREKFGIGSTKVPFMLPHISKSANRAEVTEYSDIVTSTASMNSENWEKSMMFSYFIQGFHNLGLLRYIAMYLRNENNVAYDKFYSTIIDCCRKGEYPFLQGVYEKIRGYVEKVRQGKGSLVETCDGLSDMLWGFEEILFLECFRRSDEFYGEITELVKKYFDCGEITDPLIEYQRAVVKKIGVRNVEISSAFDFYNYFRGIYLGSYSPLEKRGITLRVTDNEPVNDIDEYAREIVWYGRNKKRTDYTSDYYTVETD